MDEYVTYTFPFAFKFKAGLLHFASQHFYRQMFILFVLCLEKPF